MTWGSQAVSFQTMEGSFFRGLLWRTITPTTGTTIALKWNQHKIWIDNSATTAALTFKLPLGPGDGDAVIITSRSAVTTLTMQDGLGNAVAGAPSTLAAGASATFYYKAGRGWQVGAPFGEAA